MIDNSQPVVTLGPFLGVDLSSGPTYLGQSKALVASNVDVSRERGDFNPLFGRANFLPSLPSPGTSAIGGVTKFIRDSSGGLANEYVLVPSSGNYMLYAKPGDSSWTQMVSTDSGTGADSTNATFAKFDSRLFISQRGSASVGTKIDSLMAATAWQIDAPDGLLIAGGTPYYLASSGGNITSTGPTYYRFTYSNAYQESSPSLPVDVGPLNAQNVRFSVPSGPAQATTINLYRLDPGLPDWLLVATAGNALNNVNSDGFVIIGPNPPPYGYVYIYDNIASNLVVGQTLVQHRDRPAPFYSITRHKGRIWGFGHDAYYAKVSARVVASTGGTAYTIGGSGTQMVIRIDLLRGGVFNKGDSVTVYFTTGSYTGGHVPNFTGTITDTGGTFSTPTNITITVSSTTDAGFVTTSVSYGASYMISTASLQPSGRSNLWYSNTYEPWGFDNVRQVIPVNPNEGEDVAVDCKSVGGMLVLLKSRSTWTLYGDSPSDNQTPQEVGRDLGCLAQRSVVQALGILIWLSNQGVQMFDGNTLTNLSPDIQDPLNLMGPSDIAKCAAHFHKGTYWISFPTKAISYGYHLPSKYWTTSTFVSDYYTFDLEGTENRPTSPDVVVGNSYLATPPQLLAWYAGPTDALGALTSIYTSHVWESPDMEMWLFTHVQIIAQNLGQVPAPTISFSVTVNPHTPSEFTFTRVVEFDRNPVITVSLPNTVRGMQVQFSLWTTTTVDFAIQKVRLYGRKIRSTGAPDGQSLL